MSILEQLEGFDDTFNLDGSEVRKESVTDGEYDVEIGDAAIKETPRQKTIILEVPLFFRGGAYDGQFLKHQYWLTDTDSISRCAQDLLLMGFDSNTWNKKHNKKLSDELPKAVRRMKGIRLHVAKTTNTGSNNKVYHNIYLRHALEGFSARDNPTPTAAMPVEDDPFGEPAGSTADAGASGTGEFKLPD